MWVSIILTQGATPKGGSPHPQLKGPHQSMGVRIANSRGKTEAWESITPTQGARAKRESPHSQLKGPRQSMGVLSPTQKATPKCGCPSSPTQGATPKRGSPHPRLKGPHRSVGVHHPNSTGHTEVWESITPTQGASNVDERNAKRLSSIGPEGQRNWPGFLDNSGRLKAHIGADWLHQPCLLGVPMVGSN